MMKLRCVVEFFLLWGDLWMEYWFDLEGKIEWLAS